MVTAEEHAQVVMERDSWETIARERHAALEKLQADRSHEMIRSTVQFARLAWTLMVLMLVFSATILVAGAVRTGRAAPVPCVQSPLLERP